jgi:hypothetical protein
MSGKLQKNSILSAPRGLFDRLLLIQGVFVSASFSSVSILIIILSLVGVGSGLIFLGI